MEKHKKEVETLNGLEEQLIKLIADTDNDDLMDKFSAWQDQRAVCNESWGKFVDDTLSASQGASTLPTPTDAKEFLKSYFKGYNLNNLDPDHIVDVMVAYNYAYSPFPLPKPPNKEAKI